MPERFPGLAHHEQSLQEAYRAADGERTAMHHHNLSVLQEQAGMAPAVYLAHRLAGGVLFFQVESPLLVDSLGDLAMAFAEFSPAPPFPRTFDALCQEVETMDGVHLRKLARALSAGGGADGEEAFHAVLGTARRIAQEMRRQES